jgi:hypothetical protein
MKSSMIIISIFLAASVFAAPTHPNAVEIPVSAAPQLLIPAAGSIAGANGTFFRSDITIVNFAAHDQQVQLKWLPQPGGTVATTTITIPAQNGIRSSDFVASRLNQTGLGAILVTGVTSTGTADATALLWASSRIWTVEPGTNGTTSQSLPAVPTNALFGGSSAGFFSVSGADNPANYRTNVGIVNIDPTNSRSFTITVPGLQPTIFLVTLPPMSMQQISIGNGLPSGQEVLIQQTSGGGPPNMWIAYISNVDNITGDAWSELGVPGQ